MKVVLTGAKGFLGHHLRCRLAALTTHEVVAVGRSTFDDLPALLKGADAVVHMAGVNRGTDEEVRSGNIDLASSVAHAVQVQGRPLRIVFANTIQSGNRTPYGAGKQEAAATLAMVAHLSRGTFVDVLLPNLFGEHGRPDYNSFVATFCHEIAAGWTPSVTDNTVQLLHAQDAAQRLIDALDGGSRTVRPEGEPHGVVEILELLRAFDELYRDGEFPDLDSRFATNLFNTYRAAAFQARGPIQLGKRTDPRGSLVETVKAHGGAGQTFFSTTLPGVTRGEHYHLSKIERFVVIRGRARIQLRRLFTDEVLNFDVSGEEPTAVDMPTMWSHNITNIGDDELYTLFWTDSVFDPDHPDTHPEAVESTR